MTVQSTFSPFEPPPGPDSTLWKRRYYALWQTLESYEQWLGGLTKPSPSLPATKIRDTVKNLKAFLEFQFDFFHNGSQPAVKTQDGYILQESSDYPWDFVHTVVLDQVASDLGMLQQAVAQRYPDYAALSSAGLPRVLDAADRLACWALRPVMGAAPADGKVFLKFPPTVLTYFNRFSSIRVIPYANLALIGIPYSCLQVPTDLLAIPHEVGHYIYWHSRVDGQPLHEVLEAALAKLHLPRYVRRWAEEIFADVYGSRVAGPLFASTGQLQKQQFPVGQFFEDDGEHPAPVVRPYIYQRALHVEPEPKILVDLRKKWADHCAWRREADSATQEMKNQQLKIHNWQWVNVSDLISTEPSPTLPSATPPIDQAVDSILALLPDMPSYSKAWLTDWRSAAQGQLGDLDEDIRLVVSAEIDRPVERGLKDTQTPCAPGITTVVQDRWKRKLDTLLQPEAGKIAAGGQIVIPTHIWLEVLKFERWATKISGDARGG